jgi:hypothetical protein
MKKKYFLILIYLVFNSIELYAQNGFPPVKLLFDNKKDSKGKNDLLYFNAEGVLKENVESKYKNDPRVKIATKNFESYYNKISGKLFNTILTYMPTKYNVSSDSIFIPKDNKLVINHYKNNLIFNYLAKLKSASIMPKPVDQKKLGSFSELFDTCRIDLNRILVKNKNCEDEYKYDEETAIRLKLLIDYFVSVNCYFDEVVNSNKSWMESWLWFTKGDVRINPFGIYNPSDKLKEFNLSLITTY